MLFNTVEFAIFLPVVFILYWMVPGRNVRIQNILLLVASYYFYACWDWRFLFLLIFSTLLDYYTGLKMHTAGNQHYRKVWLWLSIGINLGFLGVFKYFNFFAISLSDSLDMLGLHTHFWTLKVILPVGISFYTFHGLSYVLDIYNRRITPETNFINYAVFVSFFPLLVAGPIERATHLLPQVIRKRTFDYSKAVDGLRQILWGLVKKVVIADTCSEYVDTMFNATGGHYGSELFLGVMFFAFQIYGDFSGYSDIAIGTARLFGIELLRNFAYPYFSRDIAEFWRRWHISLSSWFRDYLYYPLGGSRGGRWLQIRNTFIIFIVSGFWHGANWTFIVWGALNAIYFLPLLLTKTNRANLDIVAKGRMFPTPKEFISIVYTFVLTLIAWVFFRADNLHHAFYYLSQIFSSSLFIYPRQFPKFDLMLVAIFIIIEWFGREYPYAIARLGIRSIRPVRWSLYFVMITLIIVYSGKYHTFIYFQF